ncbi:hypothetical protein EVAR_25337_1 [Eumeta japonica]|uniref:Uncharacterized protein n=1 Tax=Eumeta variegata TaxID=151549 RepID=A0A4C1XVJ4_EUMVA|nr:hypothetical protein EVAR_25337_1 [Eumeta japonica]
MRRTSFKLEILCLYLYISNGGGLMVKSIAFKAKGSTFDPGHGSIGEMSLSLNRSSGLWHAYQAVDAATSTKVSWVVLAGRQLTGYTSSNPGSIRRASRGTAARGSAAGGGNLGFLIFHLAPAPRAAVCRGCCEKSGSLEIINCTRLPPRADSARSMSKYGFNRANKHADHRKVDGHCCPRILAAPEESLPFIMEPSCGEAHTKDNAEDFGPGNYLVRKSGPSLRLEKTHDYNNYSISPTDGRDDVNFEHLEISERIG